MDHLPIENIQIYHLQISYRDPGLPSRGMLGTICVFMAQTQPMKVVMYVSLQVILYARLRPGSTSCGFHTDQEHAYLSPLEIYVDHGRGDRYSRRGVICTRNSHRATRPTALHTHHTHQRSVYYARKYLLVDRDSEKEPF